MTHGAAHTLSDIAAKPAFRTIDGLSIRFVERYGELGRSRIEAAARG